MCGAAFEVGGGRERCGGCTGERARPGALVDGVTPYEHDVNAQLFVQHFERGASGEMVADALGVTRERVRQIEATALRNFVRNARRLRIDLGALAARLGVTDDDIERTHELIRADRERVQATKREQGYTATRSPLRLLRGKKAKPFKLTRADVGTGEERTG